MTAKDGQQIGKEFLTGILASGIRDSESMSEYVDENSKLICVPYDDQQTINSVLTDKDVGELTGFTGKGLISNIDKIKYTSTADEMRDKIRNEAFTQVLDIIDGFEQAANDVFDGEFKRGNVTALYGLRQRIKALMDGDK